MKVIYVREVPDGLKHAVKSVAGIKGLSISDFVISLLKENKEVADMERYIAKNKKKEDKK